MNQHHHPEGDSHGWADHVEAETPAGATGSGQRGPGASRNAPGTGNSFARQCARFHQAVVNVVTPEDMACLIRVVLDQAQAGNLAAIKLLLSYLPSQLAAVADRERRVREASRQLQATLARLEHEENLRKGLLCLVSRLQANQRPAPPA